MARTPASDATQATANETSLVGHLETWPLFDVLLWLHNTRRTAMLRIGHGLEAAVLFFHHGELSRCEWGRLAGEQALVALLGLVRGPFSLIQRDIPRASANIRRSTSELLLHCAVALDERKVAAEAGPTSPRWRENMPS